VSHLRWNEARLAPGDLLVLDWLGLDGKPTALYQIIAVVNEEFWYYKMGHTRFTIASLGTIEDGIKQGEFSATIIRQ
jgi:hypothetical protein